MFDTSTQGRGFPAGVTSCWHVTRGYRNDGVRAGLKLEVDLRALTPVALPSFQLGRPRALPALTEPAIEDDFDATIRREPLAQVSIEIGMFARNNKERESHSPSYWTAWELLSLQPSFDRLRVCVRPQSLRSANPLHKWYSTRHRCVVRVFDSDSLRGKADDDESSVLELFVNVPRHPSIVPRPPGCPSAWTVGPDPSIEDHFDLADAGQALGEILVQVCSILRDDHEDPHAPKPTASGRDPRRNFSAEFWHNPCSAGSPAEATRCA